MNFFGDAGRNRPPPPTIKKVMMKVPSKAAPKSKLQPQVFTPSTKPKPTVQKRSAPPQEPKERIRKLVKRKSHTPTPVMSSEDEDSGTESTVSSLNMHKRARLDSLPVDSNRIILDTRNRSKRDGGKFAFRHGADLVVGDSGKKYLSAFEDERIARTELQYPSDSCRERFILVYNDLKTARNTNADYQPLDDIRETIKFICTHYLPQEMSQKYLDSEHGFEWRLTKASRHGYAEDYKAVINDFNATITKAREDGTIRKVLENKHSLGDLNWVQRILDQVYSRTVSPDVDSLKTYESFSDNVYGELKPRLISEMFQKTKLKSDQVFVDLGSGVGNVVLQAALEVGCESWGIEMMENPCRLADLQRDEFAARARLWGLSVGKVHLLKGDFTEVGKINEVLKRADVVLVNNQAFTPDLNSRLIGIFLDLKDGCQIVSLKPFKPEGLELKQSNINNWAHVFLDERKEERWSDSVSWTDAPGDYYIVTKHAERLGRMKEQLQGGGRRSGRSG